MTETGDRPGQVGPAFEADADLYRELLPDDPTAEHRWVGLPTETDAYERFVRTLLGWASFTHVGPRRVLPPGPLRAPAAVASPLSITNAVLDFTSVVEGSPVHQGGQGPLRVGCWVDPDLTRIASASREARPVRTLQEQPCHVSLRQRALSLLSLDYPTAAPRRAADFFWREVIQGLCRLPPGHDHLYGWLELFFRYAQGKRVAYFSRYVPSDAITALGDRCGVEVVHFPLELIPESDLRRHEWFRFLHLTWQQWEALRGATDHSGTPAC